MARPERKYDEDFIKRAQKRLKDINKQDEQLRNTLHLPPEAKYALSSLLQEEEGATDAVLQVAMPVKSSERTYRLGSLFALAFMIAIGVGLLIFGLGLAITQVSGTNTAFATPLATLATSVILAGVMLLQMKWGWHGLLPAIGSIDPYSGNGQYLAAFNVSVPVHSTQPMPQTTYRKEIRSAPAPQSVPKRSTKKADTTKDKGAWLIVILSLLAVSVASMFLNLIVPGQALSSKGRAVSSVNSNVTGLSYGALAFDIHRSDGKLKQQAASMLAAGDTRGAISLWDKAIAMDGSDAEAFIYRENAQVLLSGQPHFTLVTGTVLTKGVTGLGRNDLQGAYIAQKEYNERARLNGGKQLMILVAMADDDPGSVTSVAQRVVQAAQRDSTILGVMGWPTSTSALAAVKILAMAHIPMLSESATSDVLTGISAYFFRMGTDTRQATYGAKYALETMHAKRVAVFEDPANAYSKSLADAFINTFIADGQHTVIKELYTVKQSESLAGLIHDAMAQQVDLIYLSGYAQDATLLLTALPPCQNAASCLQVMGGDALNTLSDYEPSAYKNFSRVHLTTFAYASESDWQGKGQQEPAFFKDYQDTFATKGKAEASDQESILPDADAILAFDSLNALLHANEQLQQDKQPVTPENLRRQLSAITFPGVSGTISFDHNGNVVNKAVLMLHLGDDHRAHLEHRF